MISKQSHEVLTKWGVCLCVCVGSQKSGGEVLNEPKCEFLSSFSTHPRVKWVRV